MAERAHLETGLAFLLTAGLLYLTQRALHRNLQLALHRLARDPEAALVLYWALLFPGVLLHELSHWIAALLLGIRRYRFVFWPRRMGGRIRLGAVQLEEGDPFRMSVIGAAPLLTGIGVIALMGGAEPSTPSSGLALWASAAQALQGLLQREGGGALLYLLFAVGNAMWPSPSDRAAWPAVGIAGGALLGLLLLAGPSSLLPALAGVAVHLLSRLTPLFALLLAVDLPVLILLLALNRLLSR
ncbi:MAG: hypothetical protein KNN16_01155 [Thermoflexus hugenholtzii]|jgi:hypothetical protein|uniref:hypothetical protein n=1 Tax=Thermoflexus TaxID=1495649 RepID=UPI001C74577E|nr:MULTISPECIES: hypothetical protein [Thermoflexus]QWK10893.1 MAG: hypothetical protein KNN16_01155 [Thermoflexus hugenholtzii]